MFKIAPQPQPSRRAEIADAVGLGQSLDECPNAGGALVVGHHDLIVIPRLIEDRAEAGLERRRVAVCGDTDGKLWDHTVVVRGWQVGECRAPRGSFTSGCG